MVNEMTTAQRVSRTVWVVAQLRGYTMKKDLAAAMGWQPDVLSRHLSGGRQWTIEDLEDAARALQLDSPGELFRPLGELVGAVTALGEDVTERVTPRYPGATSVPNFRLAQVIPMAGRNRSVTGGRSTGPATVTRLDAGQGSARAHSA